MKPATLRNSARDRTLVVVSRDQTRYCPAQAIAPTLQAALDGIRGRLAPKLRALARDLRNRRRAVEGMLEGIAETFYLKFGDVVRIEMKDAAGARSSAPSSRASSATRHDPTTRSVLRLATRRPLKSTAEARGIFSP